MRLLAVWLIAAGGASTQIEADSITVMATQYTLFAQATEFEADIYADASLEMGLEGVLQALSAAGVRADEVTYFASDGRPDGPQRYAREDVRRDRAAQTAAAESLWATDGHEFTRIKMHPWPITTADWI